MKNIKILALSFLAVIIFSFVAISQEPQSDRISLPYKPMLKKNTNHETIEFLKTKSLNCIGADITFNYNYSASDLINRNKKAKSSKPSSIKEVKKLKKKLSGNYKDALTNYQIAMVYLRLNEFALFEEYVTQAFKQSEIGISSDPENIDYYHIKAMIYNLYNNYYEMVAMYIEIINLFPDDEFARFSLIMAYSQIGDYKQAQELAKQSIEQFPDNSNYYIGFNMANTFEIFTELGQEYLTDSIADFNSDEIFDNQLLINASEKFENRNEYETLKNTTFLFQLLMSKISNFSDSESFDEYEIVFKGNELEKINNIEKFFKSALANKKMKNNYFFHYSLGIVYFLKKDLNLAISEFEKAKKERAKFAVTFDDNLSNYYDNIAAIQFLNEDTVSAMKTLKEKIKKRPSIDPNPLDYCVYANYLLEFGELEQAKENFEKAIEIQPNNIIALKGLITHSILNDDYIKAMTNIEKAADINFYDIDIHILYGILSLLSNDMEEAYTSFENAYQIDTENETLNEILEELFVPAD